ncbi:hypothetical protein Q0F99_05205 [Rathayibacter oskolensis]|uniref:DUF7882 family protein n=1 Tax=Rathayibacter oskolensis TaxID=1891671 RepID=UPI00265E5C28|nr:hypothetical protein [Rathayibacter oskolensis]WKK72371.1 hypothetical protein Q0F99_05205 [Rathayibacter oskolensis]
MGQLIYGAWRWRIDFDDRTLHHLRIALERRVKAGASFQLTWTPRGPAEHHPNSIMIHPGTPLQYRFDERDESALVERAAAARAQPGHGRHPRAGRGRSVARPRAALEASGPRRPITRASPAARAMYSTKT